MFLVLGLGLEHSCPLPREGLSSEELSLASDFFVSSALASSLVSSTLPLAITSPGYGFTVFYVHNVQLNCFFKNKIIDDSMQEKGFSNKIMR